MTRTTRLSILRWVYLQAWHERRGVVVTYLVLLAGDVLAIGGLGLALRTVIEAAMSGDAAVSAVAAAAAALCWAVTAVGATARTNLIMLLSEMVGVRLDERVLRGVGRIGGLAELESAGHADRMAVLRGGSDLAAMYAWRLLDLTATALRLLVALALLACVAPAMTVIAAALLPVLWLQRRGQGRVGRSVRASGPDTRLAEHLHALLTEPGPGAEIRVAGAGPRLRQLAADAWARTIRRQERARWAAAGLTVAGWTVFMTVYTVALLATVDAVAEGRTRPGDVLLVVMLTATLCAQAENALVTVGRHVQGVQYVDTLRELEAAATSGPSGSGPERDVGPAAVPTRLRHGIELRGVTFGHAGAASPVLRGIDLRLPAGSTVAVVGEHGAGKTTLVKLLCGLYEPDSGTITVDGHPMGGLVPQDWQRRTTVNFQDSARFAFVAREAVAAGDPGATHDAEAVARAVRQADAQQVVDALPQGLDTRLGGAFDGVELSGGQWQKIALARASMRRNPLLFVLDEPAAALDAHSENTLHQRHMAAAGELATRWGTVTLVISHRFSTVQMADHIVVLSQGRVAEQGSHTQLLALDGTYAELYRLQAEGYRLDTSAARREPGPVSPADPMAEPTSEPELGPMSESPKEGE
ncbi:ABC transporter ATP-binding protein [Streptomyces avermitilis]|uniref:ABC transporter ATP-binding protein n=1 Tax=Streptomyces avermitilis TaxID=33903 RepID=UPI00339DE4D2